MSQLIDGQTGLYDENSIVDALEKKIAELAPQDPRGKIDVVAHSMGGLLAKYYISIKGENSKIDKLILVDSPQLGTATGAFVPTHGWHGLSDGGPLQAETIRKISRYAESTKARGSTRRSARAVAIHFQAEWANRVGRARWVWLHDRRARCRGGHHVVLAKKKGQPWWIGPENQREQN